MKLRAQFVVDVTATDFVQAADHQRRLGAFLEEIKRQYSDATLTIRERRKPKLVRRSRPSDEFAASE